MIEANDIENQGHAMCALHFACTLRLLLRLHSIYCCFVGFLWLTSQAIVVHMCGLHPCSQDLFDSPLLFQLYVPPSMSSVFAPSFVLAMVTPVIPILISKSSFCKAPHMHDSRLLVPTVL